MIPLLLCCKCCHRFASRQDEKDKTRNKKHNPISGIQVVTTRSITGMFASGSGPNVYGGASPTSPTASMSSMSISYHDALNQLLSHES